MAVAGALIGKAIGAFGKKPKVPGLPEILPSQVQSDTVAGNIAASGEAGKLGSIVDQYNLEQLAKALQFVLPGGLQKAQSNINSQLAGELDPSDTSAVIRNATAAGFGSGIGRGMIGRNLVLRDLGRSSQEQKQRGFQNFLSLAGITPQPFNVTSMFFTPQQRLEFAMADRSSRFSRDLLAAQVKAAPDPAKAALGAEIDRFFNTAASVGMMAAGGGFGGGGGAAGAGGLMGGIPRTSMTGLQRAGSAGGQGVGIGQTSFYDYQ